MKEEGVVVFRGKQIRFRGSKFNFSYCIVLTVMIEQRNNQQHHAYLPNKPFELFSLRICRVFPLHELHVQLVDLLSVLVQ